MPNRIVFFGCSHTNGAGIIDTYDKSKKGYAAYSDKPSKHSYTNILAEHVDREVINKGINGASNKQISNEVLNFKYEDGDIVYVMWTHIDRSCIFKEDITLLIGPWIENEFNKSYYKHIYDSHNLVLETQHYIQLAKLHLEKNKVNFFFCCYNRTKFIENDWFDAQFLDLYFEDYKIDTAEDNHHLGIKSNKKFGTDLYTLHLKDKIKC